MQRRVLTSFLAIFLCGPHAFAVENVPIHFERMSERVLIVRCGKFYFDQVIALATQKGIVMIDTGTSPTLAAEYRKIIEREFGRNDFVYAINTHYHYDHSNGNRVFADAEIVAHESSPEKMRAFQAGLPEFIDARRAMRARYQSQVESAEPGSDDVQRGKDVVFTMGVMIDDLENDFQVTLPTTTFSDRLTLDLGDVTLKLIYFGDGRHTGDDIIIFCPEEKLLFTGDLFYKESMAIAFRPNFDVERWIEAMNYVLQDMSLVEVVLDTHNGRMPGSFLALWRDYLVDLWNGVKLAKTQGRDLAEVHKELAYAPRFTYLERSGLDRALLEREHQDGLRYAWYRANETQSAATLLEQAITESGTEAFESRYKEMRAAEDAAFYFDEAELNRLGYRLMNQNKLDQAIRVFEANVELYPQSSNVYDSLGEAYMIQGDKDRAIENYQKALVLDPDNANAVEMLKRLRSR